jgi:hypothetical protein
MTAQVPLHVGSAIILLWGAAKALPTRSVVRGFEPLSRNNRLVRTMQWVAEGLTLAFIGVLGFAISAFAGPVTAATAFSAAARKAPECGLPQGRGD